MKAHFGFYHTDKTAECNVKLLDAELKKKNPKSTLGSKQTTSWINESQCSVVNRAHSQLRVNQ